MQTFRHAPIDGTCSIALRSWRPRGPQSYCRRAWPEPLPKPNLLLINNHEVVRTTTQILVNVDYPLPDDRYGRSRTRGQPLGRHLVSRRGLSDHRTPLSLRWSLPARYEQY